MLLSFTKNTCVQVYKSQTALDFMIWSASRYFFSGNYLDHLERRTAKVAEIHVRPLFWPL